MIVPSVVNHLVTLILGATRRSDQDHALLMRVSAALTTKVLNNAVERTIRATECLELK